MMNPIRNVERPLGPGGPAKLKLLRPSSHNYPMTRRSPLKFDEGGDVQAAAPDPADLQVPADQLSPHDQQLQEIVVNAMMAIRGEHPDPQKAVEQFVQVFGEDEFRELRQMVLQGGGEPDDDEEEPEPDQDEEDQLSVQPQAPGGMQVGGLLKGPGTGQSDEIEAATPSGRKVLLSDGEYVIDAPTVAAIGDGSTNAGARRLDNLRKAVRQQTYGTHEQAKPLKKGGRVALLEALNS